MLKLYQIQQIKVQGGMQATHKIFISIIDHHWSYIIYFQNQKNIQIQSMTSDNSVKAWIGTRQAVASAVLITYFTYYLIHAIIKFKPSRKAERTLQQIGSKIYLFGFASLLSVSYIQAGIYPSIMSFLSMVCILGLLYGGVFLQNFDQRLKTLGFIGYYGLIFVWYLGLIIQFYVNDKNNKI